MSKKNTQWEENHKIYTNSLSCYMAMAGKCKCKKANASGLEALAPEYDRDRK